MRSAIEMAKEAGFMLRAESVKGQSDWWECFDEAIEKLVALARADERDDILRMSGSQWFKSQARYDEAIRARGNP
jgi:hypothetical protein